LDKNSHITDFNGKSFTFVCLSLSSVIWYWCRNRKGNSRLRKRFVYWLWRWL